MKNNIDKSKMLYWEKEKFLYSILLSALLYFFIFTLLYDVPNLFTSILAIIYLVGACTIVMLCKSIISIQKKVYYQLVSCMYMWLAMVSMFKMIPLELINNRFLLALRDDVFLNTVYMQYLAVWFYDVVRFINGDFDKNKRHHLKRVSTFVILLNGIFFVNYIAILINMEWVIVFNNIFILVFMHFQDKKLKGVRTVIGSKVNTVILFMYIIKLIAIANIVTVVVSYKYTFVIFLHGIVMFVTYIYMLVSIIDKLISRPYKMLFADLYKENIELDILNGKVVKKNRELELSQAIIRKKEKMFKTFFVNVPVPLVIISKNGRILFANSSFQKLLEEDNIKNIINKKIINIIDINNFKNVDQLMEEKDSKFTGVIRSNRNTKYVDIDVVEISGNENEILFILNDVTTRVNIGKLKTDMENTKFQERIKSDFLSNISHDLKTPINVIYSASQLITMFIKKEDKQSLIKYNMICKLNCFSLIRLTNNLIDSSRIYSDYLSPNICVKNIVEIVEEVVMSLIDYAKSKNINLVFDTDEEEIYTSIDEEFMQRIIINLISNSIKFTNKDGKIEVIIHNEEKEVVIKVKDNGVGMDNEFIESAFKRYSMGKNNSQSKEKGTGIGLFVVKKLIEKQDGKINIISEKNKGTEVQMRFNKEM